MDSRRLYIFSFLSLASLGFFVDQLTKYFVRKHMAVGELREFFGLVKLHHVHNTGIAFGLFKGAGVVVIAATAIIALGVFVYVLRLPAMRWSILIAAAGIAGGAAGNLLDRLRLSFVTDFLEVPHWPTFNVADCLIVVGVIWIALQQVISDIRSTSDVGGGNES